MSTPRITSEVVPRRRVDLKVPLADLGGLLPCARVSPLLLSLSVPLTMFWSPLSTLASVSRNDLAAATAGGRR